MVSGDEFVIDEDTISLMNQYEDITDDLHTDLHDVWDMVADSSCLVPTLMH